MNLLNHLDKNNLHHAYLIEGEREEIELEIFKFIKTLGIEISNNPDFCHISVDSFSIEDARNLKSIEHEKSFSPDSSTTGEANNKKIFLISANNLLREAQNTLLKIFEEPIENTHFFIIIPNVNTLLKTLVSRFYFISNKQDLTEEIKEAKEFIKMPLSNRLEFIKELLTVPEEEDDEIIINSARAKSLKFLNALESILVPKMVSDNNIFQHFFKVREFLSQPGSSLKSLMESVALIVPHF